MAPLLVIAVPLGIILTVLAVRSYRSVRPLLGGGERAEGSVVRLEGNEYGTGWQPVVEFRAGNRPATITAVSWYGPAAFAVGQKVPVRYPKGRPEQGRIDSFRELYGDWLVNGLAGVGFLASSVIIALGVSGRIPWSP